MRLKNHKTTDNDYVHLNNWEITVEVTIDELEFASSQSTSILIGQSRHEGIKEYDFITKR